VATGIMTDGKYTAVYRMYNKPAGMQVF